MLGTRIASTARCLLMGAIPFFAPWNAVAQSDEQPHWNLNLRSYAGHTGNVLVRPEGQLHEGPGRTGLSCAYHWHPRDPITGELQNPGVPLDRELRPLALVAASPKRPGPSDVQAMRATVDPITLCAEAITPEIEKLLLNADWAATERRLPLDDDEITSPLIRLLLGHAALVGNRGNDALVLFWSCLDPLDLSAWDRWTTDLLQRFPNKSVAHYLRGDALARLGRWAPAVEAFTRAINADPSDSAIAFNARGVAHIGLKELEAAKNDLDRAIELDPRLLDAFSSLGRYWLLKKAGQNAFECYARVVDADPNSLIGINGRACAQFGLADWDAAVRGFRVLLDRRPDFAVEYNLAVVVDARCALALAAAGGEAAMGIERRYDLAELGRATWDAKWGIANARELGLTNSWVLPMRIDAWGTGWAVPGFARGAAGVRITMRIDPGAELKSWSSGEESALQSTGTPSARPRRTSFSKPLRL